MYTKIFYFMLQGEAGDGTEPDWVAAERLIFKSERDTDGDGFMSFDEIKTWIVPDDFDHADTESKYLMSRADADGDQVLTNQKPASLSFNCIDQSHCSC